MSVEETLEHLSLLLTLAKYVACDAQIVHYILLLLLLLSQVSTDKSSHLIWVERLLLLLS